MEALTRRRLEIEGYCELGMWDDAQALLEELSDGVTAHPEILAALVMLGVALEFGGPRRIPSFFTPSPAHAQNDWARAELSQL